MAYDPINLGATANDGTGDKLRAGGVKINAMFAELYTALASKAAIATTLAGYGITDAYTIAQVDALFTALRDGVSASLDTLAEIETALAAKQPLDTDLTAWAGVNPSSYSTTAQIAAAYQPLDADLTAIAALSTASFGRSLLELAAAVNLRSAAGLAISTSVGGIPVYSGTTGAQAQSAVIKEENARIGIGLAGDAPLAALDVGGGSGIRSRNGYAMIDATSGFTGAFGVNGTGVYFYTPNATTMLFCVNGYNFARGFAILPSTYNVAIGKNTANARLDVDGDMRLKTFTVATLPTDVSTGKRAFVSDANATLAANLGSAVAGGGANFSPVYADGSGWKQG